MKTCYWIEQFKNTEKKYIYGAGFQAQILLNLFEELNISVDAIVVNHNSRVIESVKSLANRILYVDEMTVEEKQNSMVVIAAPIKHCSDIKDLLSKCGFENIWYPEDWSLENSIIRDIVWGNSLARYNVKLQNDVICYKDENIDFKMQYNNQDHILVSMIQGEWNDLIVSSLWDKNVPLGEGSYENDHVYLESGDVVLDIGANIGMFSCVAAAKGCEVYAFEPTKEIYDQLMLNVKLNPQIHPIDLVVVDYCGTIDFYENTYEGENKNMGQNSIYAHPSDIERKVTHSTTTIDEFVRENGLERVDFIKADIEGSERLMLNGARETLKRFAPKLSLCTYHLPDDPEVMKQIILESNPNYVIEQSWCKMYCYVPK